MATPTGKVHKRIWNPDQASPYPLMSREDEAADEKMEVVSDLALANIRVGKEGALAFFWKKSAYLERRPPDQARGAIKRKWAFIVRSATIKLESALISNSKHRLWKALRKCDSAPVRKAILDAAMSNR